MSIRSVGMGLAGATAVLMVAGREACVNGLCRFFAGWHQIGRADTDSEASSLGCVLKKAAPHSGTVGIAAIKGPG
jgi:hypothetical protein